MGLSVGQIMCRVCIIWSMWENRERNVI